MEVLAPAMEAALSSHPAHSFGISYFKSNTQRKITIAPYCHPELSTIISGWSRISLERDDPALAALLVAHWGIGDWGAGSL